MTCGAKDDLDLMIGTRRKRQNTSVSDLLATCHCCYYNTVLFDRFGARYFLGVGMLINSVFGLLVPVAAEAGFEWLILVRFIQGLGEVRDL